MGVFHKDKPHKKHEYRSEDVVDDSKAERGPSFTQRGAPELVINDAPQRPPWGGKGVEDDTRYKFSRGADDGDADGSAEGATAGAPGSGAAREGPGKAQAPGGRPELAAASACAGMHVQHAQGRTKCGTVNALGAGRRLCGCNSSLHLAVSWVLA